MPEVLNVSCIQMCSGENTEYNLKAAEHWLSKAAAAGSQWAILPENFALMTQSSSKIQKVREKQAIIQLFLQQQAKKHHLWIAATALASTENENTLCNRCTVVDTTGHIQAEYDKIHLFDADLDTESWRESELIQAGKTAKTVCINKHWTAGLSICYDLRFPELYRQYSAQNCNIITVPAAFTVPTGLAHWQTLLQARAIENQSYVLAAAQSGKHDDGRNTYGHSMIIDPWGKIIAALDQGEGIIHAQLSLEHVQHIRHILPALQHRRIT